MADNWSRGEKGFQARLDESQQKALYECWLRNDWKNTPARDMLKRSFGIELPDRTLGDYKRRLKSRFPKDKDNPIDWADFATLTRNSIPSHLLSELHDMDELIETLCLTGNGTVMTRIYLPPTYRSVKWWGYLIQYFGAHIKSVHDRQLIAEQFSTREYISDYTNKPMERKDIDSWLMYKPWQSSHSESLYLTTIAEGKIPPLDYSKFGYGLERLSKTATFEHNLSVSHMGAISKFLELTPKPYLLPLQIWNHYAEEIDPLFIKKYLKEEVSEK